MRKLLALSAIAAMASLATAGGEDVKVEVSKARVSSSKADPAFRMVPASYSNALLCNLRRSERLDKMVNEIVDQELSQVRTINKEDVAVSLIELCPDDGGPAAIGHLHGEEMLYASGLARVPYAAALYSAKGRNGGSLPADMKADIMASLRDANYGATNRLIDHLRAIKGGEYANVYLNNIGFENFNVNQRFVTGDPTGIDADTLGRKLHMNWENSNRMTSNQAAGLFYLLAHDALVSPGASQAMKAYMHHPLEQKKIGPLQGVAAGLPVGSKIVTANGYNVRNYHEAALVELPNGKKYVLSIMSKYNDYPTVFIPLVSRTIAFRMMTSTGDEDPSLHNYIPALAGAR